MFLGEINEEHTRTSNNAAARGKKQLLQDVNDCSRSTQCYSLVLGERKLPPIADHKLSESFPEVQQIQVNRPTHACIIPAVRHPLQNSGALTKYLLFSTLCVACHVSAKRSAESNK